MPAPLDIDRDAVKAHVLTHGVRPAAAHFGLSPATVGAWSARYGWLAPAKEIVANPSSVLPASMRPANSAANTVNSPSVAAKNALASLGDKSRLLLAKSVKNTATALSKKKGDDAIKVAGALKSTVEAGSKLHGWDGTGQSVSLRLELIASPAQADAPLTLDAETGEVV